MRELIYIPSGLQTPELEIMLSKAQISIDKTHETFIAVCSGKKNYACSFNVWGLSNICASCKKRTNSGIEKLTGTFHVIETPPLIDEIYYLNNKYDKFDVTSLKQFTFLDVDVGQSVYSSYIGSTRDLNIDGYIADVAIKKLLQTSITLTQWFKKIQVEFIFSKVTIYNARQNQYRPILRIARQFNIDVDVMEFSGLNKDGVYTFKNVLPQDLDMLQSRIDDLWEVTECNKYAVAEYYFQFKRAGGFINDTKSYVNNQTTGSIPLEWDSNKKNIVIFNSSEDEFAALGGEYDNSLYISQLEAIKEIVHKLSYRKDLHIWLRVHPNLKDVKWDFATDLLNFQSVNFTVIKGESKISSYAILDAADLVVSFGSTMGIEAAYWNKPSILLSRCIYERSKSVYVPKTKKEVIELISNVGQLPPLNKEGAIKAAIFWSKGGSSLKYFGGNRMNGFLFNGSLIKHSKLWSINYYISKFIEKVFIEKLLNFYFRKKKST